MSRAFDMVVVAVVITIAYFVHYMSALIFKPGGPLYRLATDGTANMNGAANAQFMFEVLTIWIPLIGALGVIAWATLKEYRRQTQTTRVRNA